MPLPHHPPDFEFSPAALSAQIVRSAQARDPVRLERAIRAALEINGAEQAERTVFGPARGAAAAVGQACAAAVAQAIDTYVNVPRVADAAG